MTDPQKNKPLIVAVDPVTLVFVIAALLFIPLLISGFIFQ
jgi:hypothetical protein